MARKKAAEANARPDAPKLRAVAVQFKDVLGLREFGFAPGKVTEISGLNGVGKTSALKALEVTLGGGNLASLARIDPEGAETAPEVVLVLAATDRSETYRVKRTAEGVKVQMRVGDSPALKDLDMPPAAWLRSIFDSRGANPVDFLLAKDPDRVLMVLEALTLTLDRGAVAEILGDLQEHVQGVPEGLNALEELRAIRDAVFNARTGVNRSMKEKAAAAEQMRQSTPTGSPESLKSAIDAQQEEVQALAAAIAKATADAEATEKKAVAETQAAVTLQQEKIQGSARVAISTLEGDHRELAASIRAAAEKRIAEASAETKKAVAKVQADADKAMDETRVVLERVKNEARDAREVSLAGAKMVQEELAASRESLARLQEQDRIAAKAKGLIEQAEKYETEVVRLEGESGRMTAALDALDTFRLHLLEELPIKGLEIEGKSLKVDGVPFDQLNEGRRVEIAVEVGALRVGRLPLLLIDGAERLDEAHELALARKLEEKGIQAIMTRVVRTLPAELAPGAETKPVVRDLFGDPS